MDVLNFSPKQFELFVLTLVRVSALFALVPVFGSRNLPVQMKVGLSLFMSIIIFSVLKLEERHYDNIFSFVAVAGMEVVIGMVIGYASRLVFSGIQIAGYLMGFQMGFAIVNVFDPTTDSQVSIISEMKYIFAVLIFLMVNAHHWVIRAIVESFELIPLGGAVVGAPVFTVIVDLFGNMFLLAIKIGAPIVATILFINVSLGLIARTVPQMNVFIVGFPLQIGMGMMMLGLSMPFFYYLFVHLFRDYGSDLLLLLRAMGV